MVPCQQHMKVNWTFAIVHDISIRLDKNNWIFFQKISKYFFVSGVLLYSVGQFVSSFSCSGYCCPDNFGGKDYNSTLHGVSSADVLSWALYHVGNGKWLLWNSSLLWLGRMWVSISLRWLFMGFSGPNGHQTFQWWKRSILISDVFLFFYRLFVSSFSCTGYCFSW